MIPGLEFPPQQHRRMTIMEKINEGGSAPLT